MMETRADLAAAYKNQKATAAGLTHAVEVTDNLHERVLCGRVNPEHLADAYATDVNAAPTCPRCLAKLAKGAL